MLRPLVSRLAALGVSANQVTLGACLLSLLTGGLIAWQPHEPRLLFLIPVVMVARMALNAVDGMLAREHNMKTPLGAILNELTDVISDAALILPFCLVNGFSPAWVVALVWLAALGEMTGVVGVQIGASRRYDGPLGKSDRAFVFGLLALLLGFGVPLEAWLTPILVLLCFLAAVTVVNRAVKALGELDS